MRETLPTLVLLVAPAFQFFNLPLTLLDRGFMGPDTDVRSRPFL
jgi:hypothetical protein